jgi:hypothetical protein
MRKVSVVFVFATCAVIGFSINASAADLSDDVAAFGEYLDSQSGSCGDEGISRGAFNTVYATNESACYISTWCPNGSPQVSCSGSVSCSNGTICNGLPYVECDGVRTYCSRSWCQTKLCCSFQPCDDWCDDHGYPPIGGCYQGCCECLEM